MSKGNRSILNWLLSGVSVSTAYGGFAFFVFLIGLMAFFSLGQVEEGIHIFVRQYDEEAFKVFVQSVYYLKYIIFAAFTCVSIFIYLFGKGVRSHIFNQGYALELQLDSFLNGDLDYRRSMRRHDELKEVMTKIHQLSEKKLLKKGSS